MSIIKLNAGNDRNGNPRCVFVLLDSGIVKKVWDGGYKGSSVIPDHLRKFWMGESFLTTPNEYRYLLKTFGG